MGKEQTNNAPVFDHANRMEDIRVMTKTSIHFSILLSASYSFRLHLMLILVLELRNENVSFYVQPINSPCLLVIVTVNVHCNY